MWMPVKDAVLVMNLHGGALDAIRRGLDGGFGLRRGERTVVLSSGGCGVRQTRRRREGTDEEEEDVVPPLPYL